MTILGRAKKAAEAPPPVQVGPTIAPGAGKAPVGPKKRAAGGTKNKAKIHAVIGASGTGKSSYIKKDLLRDYDQLIVWSP